MGNRPQPWSWHGHVILTDDATALEPGGSVPGRGAPSSPRTFRAPLRASGLDGRALSDRQGLGCSNGYLCPASPFLADGRFGNDELKRAR
jgi:hypothetical protein